MAFICLIVILSFSPTVMAVDEDSATLFERGILNWIHYQKIILSDNVYKVEITNNGLQSSDIDVVLANRRIHGTLIFENTDDAVHRIVFTKHIGNNLGFELKSPAINKGERWAVDIMKDGIYPFQCSLHPGKIHGVMQVWYEEEEFW